MSKALETLWSDFTPSELQQAAIERIKYFQLKLKENYGMHIRSAIELEFMVENADGNPIRAVIDLSKPKEYFDQQGLPYIEKFTGENDFGSGSNRYSGATAKYEINIAEEYSSHPGYRPQPELFDPAAIAMVTAGLKDVPDWRDPNDLPKKYSLASMLKETSCLTDSAVGALIANRYYRPNFSARPYYHRFEGEVEVPPHATSGMHINVSLYDAQARNGFVQYPGLIEHCANSLVDIQDKAGLAFLPYDASLLRMGANTSVPGKIGVMEGNAMLPSGTVSSSVSIRKCHDNTRIENRMPGADADPFVAMAVTVAALYDAVSKYVRKNEYGEIKVTGKSPGHAEHTLPDSHSDLVKRLEYADDMKILLGDRLYGALLRDYKSGEMERDR